MEKINKHENGDKRSKRKENDDKNPNKSKGAWHKINSQMANKIEPANLISAMMMMMVFVRSFVRSFGLLIAVKTGKSQLATPKTPDL